jgi:glycerol-3-phosphate dehydrogenase
MSKKIYDVAIIGAGVVGTAIARELSKHNISIAVLDAHSDVGDGTSKANTAILHTGFDMVPGSLESKLVARGYHLLRDYARETGIAVEELGALLVAWSEEEHDNLHRLLPLLRKPN